MAGRAEWAGQQTDKHLSLWSWGANSYGQLGNGTKKDVLKPREITPFPIPDLPILITGGGGHTLILTDKHQIWLCGSNNKGQLGLGTTSDVVVPTLVTRLQDESVVVVTGGWDFSMAVTATGKLYSWGSNAFGQLGSTDRGKFSPLPACVPISFNYHITNVAAGMRHAVAVSDSGQVFTWGYGKRGQLGILIEGEIPDKLPTPHQGIMYSPTPRGCQPDLGCCSRILSHRCEHRCWCVVYLGLQQVWPDHPGPWECPVCSHPLPNGQ